MGAHGAQRRIDGATRRFIRFKAWELAQNSAFTLDEQPDLKQELTLDLLQRMARFDPHRGTWTAFVHRIVQNKMATLLEHRLAARRNPHRVAFSLDQSFDDGEGGAAERGEVFDPGSIDRSWATTAADHDLWVDLARAIYRLPPDLADLALRLGAEGVTEISASTGIPRGTLYDAIGRIREALQDAGLQDYLGGRRFRRRSGT